MDNKYGRLFTAEDVVKILTHEAHPAFMDGSDAEKLVQLETITAEVERDGGQFKFPEDEPLFLLRAQDKLAWSVLDEYRWLLSEAASDGHDINLDSIGLVMKTLDEFEKFKEAHEDQMKYAD